MRLVGSSRGGSPPELCVALRQVVEGREFRRGAIQRTPEGHDRRIDQIVPGSSRENGFGSLDHADEPDQGRPGSHDPTGPLDPRIDGAKSLDRLLQASCQLGSPARA